MDEIRMAGLMGLANRARLTVFGEDGCVSLIRSGKAALCLVDEAVSPNGLKRYQDACKHKKVKMALLPRGMIANAVGKSGRMAVAMEKGGLTEQLAVLSGAQVPCDE